MPLHNFDYTLSSFTSFSPEKLNLERQWGVADLQISCTKINRSVAVGKFILMKEKLSKFSDFYYLETGLYRSITFVAEPMNALS